MTLLYIRYPGRPWTAFDLTNPSIAHQKEGLDRYTASGQDTLDVSLPHPQGGEFQVTYSKIVDEKIVLYYYNRFNGEAVQMMYAEPAYAAYINRLTT